MERAFRGIPLNLLVRRPVSPGPVPMPPLFVALLILGCLVAGCTPRPPRPAMVPKSAESRQDLVRTSSPAKDSQATVIVEQVSIPPSAEAKQLGLPGSLAFAVLVADRKSDQEPEKIGTLGFILKRLDATVGPEPTWCAGIAWAEDGTTCYVLLSRSRRREVELEVHKFDVKKPLCEGRLTFGNGQRANQPEQDSAVSCVRIELSQWGKLGKGGPVYQTGVERIQAALFSDHLLVFLERGDSVVRNRLSPVYLRFDLNLKKWSMIALTELETLSEKP